MANCESYLLGSIQISTILMLFHEEKATNIAIGAKDVLMMPKHPLLRNLRLFLFMCFALPTRVALASVPSENAHYTKGAYYT